MLFNVRLVVHPNALKHGSSVEQVRQAYETGSGGARIRRGDEDVEPARWATIGFDSSGRPIEMVFVRGTGRSVLVIHANWLTKGFLAQMRRSR